MKKCTVCFCVRGGNVLLALKKRGFGKNWLNGYGGKVKETDRTIETSLVRELREEAKIEAREQDLNQVGHIIFTFNDTPTVDCRIFLLEEWKGDPKETEEMGTPEWYPIDELPKDRMWKGDRLWVPRILNGESLSGRVDYLVDENDKDKPPEVAGYIFTPEIF